VSTDRGISAILLGSALSRHVSPISRAPYEIEDWLATIDDEEHHVYAIAL
jgi:hypothetical protein